MYWVIGTTAENGCLKYILLRSEPFKTLEAAKYYCRTTHEDWHAFVVEESK